MARHRTFVALEIPDFVRARAAAIMELLRKSSSSIRWVKPENLHLTVKFLGDIDEADLYEVCRAVQVATGSFDSFTLECAGVGAFPSADRPRTIWLRIEDPEGQLESLVGSVESQLKRLGFPREARRFVPHITMGRIQHGRRNLGDLTTELAKHAEARLGDVVVDELVVFSSELTPGGSIYTALGRAELR
jgi:2'-5' RNA ligase